MRFGLGTTVSVFVAVVAIRWLCAASLATTAEQTAFEAGRRVGALGGRALERFAATMTMQINFSSLSL